MCILFKCSREHKKTQIQRVLESLGLVVIDLFVAVVAQRRGGGRKEGYQLRNRVSCLERGRGVSPKKGSRKKTGPEEAQYFHVRPPIGFI